MKIGVIGAGYVGLVAGACLAEMGNDVVIADRDKEKIELLRAGRTPHFEPGLGEICARNSANGRIRFSCSATNAVAGMDVVFIAAGSPPTPEGAVDMSAVEAAVAEVARALTGYCVLVIKSTVPPGSNRRIEELIRRETAHPFDLVSNPEFLKEGTAVNDFMHPDRVVVGARSDRARTAMRQVYNSFFRTGYRMMETDPESAEMIKYASNIMLAARISLMNELSGICQAVGADVENVRIGVGLDKRIGTSFLFPGLGYGGSCFPKDVKAVVDIAKKNGIRAEMCRAIDSVNTLQRDYFLPVVEELFGTDWSDRTFAILGLSYKPRTDDIRESPALDLAGKLMQRGGTVQAFDPEAGGNARKKMPALRLAANPIESVTGADAVFLCTEWNEFRNLDWRALCSRMKRPLVFDGRNLYSREEMAAQGITYFSIGRTPVRPEN
jgi:UDPglucose 6-dehydrogenase